MMNLRDRVWPYVISALAVISALLVTLDVSVAPRAALVLAFATMCPGMALVRLLRLDDPWAELILAFVVSLALAGVLATVSVYLGGWNARLVLLATVEIALMAVLADLLRSSRHPF